VTRVFSHFGAHFLIRCPAIMARGEPVLQVFHHLRTSFVFSFFAFFARAMRAPLLSEDQEPDQRTRNQPDSASEPHRLRERERE
jgi:hypothetical protein